MNDLSDYLHCDGRDWHNDYFFELLGRLIWGLIWIIIEQLPRCRVRMQVPNLINETLSNNPMGQMAADYALRNVNSYIGKMQISNYTNQLFNAELRSYFDIDTVTAKNKLLKTLLPFKNFEFDDSIKKLDLYLPIVSFMTLIMFSTLYEGIIFHPSESNGKSFQPNIMNKVFWIMFLTALEVGLAKFTENAVAHLNLGFIELFSLVSYRFISLSAVLFFLVITSGSWSILEYIGGLYALFVDFYYCQLELSNCCRERFKEEGVGNKIALLAHTLTTVAIMWRCSIIF